MRNLLIVSPHFPPVNAADAHRVRLSLRHFAEFGWHPIVLAVNPDCVEMVRDPLLMESVPRETPVYHAEAFNVRWTRELGVGAIGLRAWPFLRRMGAALIREHKPHLIYFSTTAFPVMTLGRIWKKKFGTPFVVDLQDPWVSDYYDKKVTGPRPPKHSLAQLMHRMLEPYTMRAVDGIVAVTSAYHETLRKRYPWIRESVCRTIPFGASEDDFDVAEKMEWINPFFTPGDGFVHGVYVGVLGRVMEQTCRAICLALRRGLETEPVLFSKLRLHFIGTDYAPADRARPTIQPLAKELGLQSFIQEDTNRVPYFSALRLLREADFLLVPGSDNSQYTASKIYPYIVAKKPMLAVFHRESSVVQVLESTKAGRVATFASESSAEDIARALLPEWRGLLRALPFTPITDWTAFHPYTAREMTRRQCELFDTVMNRGGTDHGRNPCASLAIRRSRCRDLGSMILPNFIGIGAPKAGTTWMAACLGEHPEVFMAAMKETEFWKFGDAELRLPEYEAHFKGANGKRAVGEFSVRYLSLPGVPERIKRAVPEAKLIVCLRNPADQVYSNYWHLQRQNFNLADRSKVPRSIEEAVRDHRDFLLGPARYATHLARWYQIFPHDQLLVVLYDDIQKQPAEVMMRTFAFLGVDPEFRPPSTVEKGSVVRQGTSPRSEASARWHGRVYGALAQRVYTPLKKMLGTRRAAHMKEVLRVRPIMERLFMRKGYPPMSGETRALLVQEFALEIEELAQLTGLSFERWK